MLAYLVQFGGERFHPGRGSLLEPLILVAFVVCLGAVAVPLLGVLVAGSRGALRGWRGRRRRLRAAASAELRARALMSELCPYGWRAQISLLSSGAPAESRHGSRERVVLEWAELQDASTHPAVMRRVVAPTIGEALDAMVADRRTDQTLEQIEQSAVADGILWPDV